ncbi:hypothetical protein [Sphingomonas sp.]|jgi:hypothetical protein|uniref:hypothetical protein n=1 Tax=Sphingomonas sp. TaxID=28214 RepID=UPI002EDBA27A
MSSLDLRTNSLDSQLQEIGTAFGAVAAHASDYEQHQYDGAEKLHVALGELFSFGEALRAQPKADGISLMEAFIVGRSGTWNKVTRENPYNALVKLAFTTKLSAASFSQYATVLRYAHHSRVEPSALARWLQEGGIKGRYSQASAARSEVRQSLRSKAKLTRLELAKQLLSESAASEPVAMPVPVKEGFATVLVRIDAHNNAEIIDLIEADEAALSPILLRYAPQTGVVDDLLAAKPLGRLHRAIELIAMLSPKGSKRAPRLIAITNLTDRGQNVCRVEAACKAYSYPWAATTLADHVPMLPVGQTLTLDEAAIACFVAEFQNHDGWQITKADDGWEIEAEQFRGMIPIRPLESNHGLNVALATEPGQKDFALSPTRAMSIKKFIDARRQDHDRRASKQKLGRSFPNRVGVDADPQQNRLWIDGNRTAATEFVDATGSSLLSKPAWFSVRDIEALMSVLTRLDIEVRGWFGDTDIADAQLNIIIYLPTSGSEADIGYITIPTVISAKGEYAPSCVPLVGLSGPTR